MKRSIVLLTCMLLIATVLSACGGLSGKDPNIGIYRLDSLMGVTAEEFDEKNGENGEKLADMMSIELKEDGKAIWKIQDEEDQELEWSLDGEKLLLTIEGEEQEATLQNGTITLQLEDEISIEMIFKKEADNE